MADSVSYKVRIAGSTREQVDRARRMLEYVVRACNRIEIEMYATRADLLEFCVCVRACVCLYACVFTHARARAQIKSRTVPADLVGALIGHAGRTIGRIEEDSGVIHVKIDKANKVRARGAPPPPPPLARGRGLCLAPRTRAAGVQPCCWRARGATG